MSLPVDPELSRLCAALTAAGDVAYDWDVAGDSVVWVGSAEALGQESFAPLGSGRALAQRVHPEDLPARQQRINQHFAEGDAFECEYRIRTANGTFQWVHDRGAAERDGEGRPLRMRGVLRACGDRKSEAARVELLANYDELTGHFNRSRLSEAIDHVLAYGRRTATPGAFLAIGIDNTTMLNDAFGGEAADIVLVEVGRRLDRCLGLDDVIGRIGGDRFGILLGRCPGERIGGIAERILASVSRAPVVTSVGPIYVTVSIGSVTFPGEAGTAHEVLTRAETALAAAKRAGRDTHAPYRLTDTERKAHRDGMAIGERVQRALSQDRLVFAYQPVVDSTDSTVDYYECLLRLREEDGSVTAAGLFVPAVEQLGFIRTLDRYVLEKAVAELVAAPTATLGFNISGLTAADRAWLRAAESLLAGRPQVASRIVVEITETAALHDIPESARFVSTLRELGCRVALDDFGVGFTSLRHLQTLGVDIVKIDGSFVRGLPGNEANQVFVRHLLGLARGFGLDTVAECVETAEEAAILRREGVRSLQGWYYGKPMLERPWETAPLRATAAS